MRYPLLITAMGGLGDGIYQRPFIRQLQDVREVFLATPWPELYADLPNVRFVKPVGMGLRTQAKNIERYPDDFWNPRPIQAERIRPHYGMGMHTRETTILRELEQFFPRSRRPLVMDLPDFGEPPIDLKQPYAVVRPVTVRKEWAASARAPDPKYVATASKALRKFGFKVVTVADVDGKQEKMVGDPPPADERFEAGELAPAELLALIQNAAVVVGGVGFIVPACMATKTPAVVIGGGMGGTNGPDVLTDLRVDSSHMEFLLPEPYCRCSDMRHECNRTIPRFSRRLHQALGRLSLEEAAA